MIGIQVRSICRKLEQLSRISLKEADSASKEKWLNYVDRIGPAVKRSIFVSKSLKKRFALQAASFAYQQDRCQRLKAPDQKWVTELTQRATAWKANQFNLELEPQLNAANQEKLQELACYPLFVKILIEDREALNKFFKWSITNHLSVGVFVEYNHMTALIDRSLLKGRLGAFEGRSLRLINTSTVKTVQMEFEGRFRGILRPEKKIALSHGLCLTVKEIFKRFSRKNLVEGCLTVLPKGICHWDPHQFGYLNKKKKGGLETIDLDRPDWFMQLPEKARLTSEEATKQFGFPCDGRNWVLTVVAKSQTPRLDVFGAHAFFRVAIPLGDGTYFYTFGWGKYARQYPQNCFQSLGMLYGAVKATLEYPDNNEKYTYRKPKEVHFSLNAEKGEALLDSLKRDLLNARSGNLAFQILIENCTDWIAKKVRKYVGIEQGKLFDIPFLELEPSGCLSSLMKTLRKSSPCMRDAILYSMAFIMGGSRSQTLTKKDGTKRKVSIMANPPWKRVFHHPAVLFRKSIAIN